ncbi:Stealth CR1 domain-containing protein [Ideonella azotifigens]|uniref:Stealth CR1 domain-containing protein n=1 Tax=Ideonella azotifigens TaxID=513160 RepID=A0ABN1KME1_9BURK|nr:stealth family protein [Ideonella azotifigens]MCD2343480.1 Stealth CR1 domain-containing protein [Ideonella azotifigens]
MQPTAALHTAEPIDAVIAWVDGQDPRHRAKLEAYLAQLGCRPAAAAPTRFNSVGEIDYCVASLLRFAPFLRRIHIVADEQAPAFFERVQEWPAQAGEKLRLVDHKALFAGHEDCLPTFNCRSIETLLHRIPGLAEQFVYLNDDFMLIKPVQPEDWFRDGQPVLRGHWRVAPEQRWHRRLRDWWQARRGSPVPDRRPGHQEGQALSARLAGYDGRYLEHDHHPHPLRRSTLEAYFAAHPQALRQNIVHRLRDARQFLPPMLAGHLEIRAGSAALQPDPQTVNLKPARTAPGRLARKLRGAAGDPAVLFACIQSLDEAPSDVQGMVVQWLDQVVGPLDQVLRQFC